MPKCKICGEDVRAGTVLHVECYEAWEADISERAETIRERENELNLREMELDIREGGLDRYYEESIKAEKQAKRLLVLNLAVAAFTVLTALVGLFL